MGPGFLLGPLGPGLCLRMRLQPRGLRPQLCSGASVSRPAPTSGSGAGLGRDQPCLVARGKPWTCRLSSMGLSSSTGGWCSDGHQGLPQEFSETACAAVLARGAPPRAGRILRAGHPGWRGVWLSQEHRRTWHLQRQLDQQRQHRRELPHGQPCSEGFLSRAEGYERLGGGSSFGSHRGLCLVTTTQPSTALAFELHVGPHGKVVLGVILPAGAQDVAVGTEVSVHRENQVY